MEVPAYDRIDGRGSTQTQAE